MTTPRLAVDDRGVATVLLARPRHLNRLHREDLAALREHFAATATDARVRVVVLTGQGRAFCAGFNLDQLGADCRGDAHLDPPGDCPGDTRGDPRGACSGGSCGPRWHHRPSPRCRDRGSVAGSTFGPIWTASSARYRCRVAGDN